MIYEAPSGGALIYLPGSDGRGHGLSEKARIVALERRENQTPVFASRLAGIRYANYDSLNCLPFILDKLGFAGPFRLATNSPQKYAAVANVGIPIHSICQIEIDQASLSRIGIEEILEKHSALGHALATAR